MNGRMDLDQRPPGLAASGRGVSRRAFMGQAAAIPLAARLEGPSRFGATPPRVVVVGAGAFGGWTALHLLRDGASVVLIDAWGAGNARSSSGGETRVIRAIYGPDRPYVEMVRRSYELWEQLDATQDERLYVETGSLWMHRGDDSYVRSSLPILEELGFPVEKLAVPAAARCWPQIEFDGIESVWLESRAGVLSASRACAAVRDAFVRSGGAFRVARATPGPIAGGSMTALMLDDGSRLEADLFVFACGPWLGRLFPDVLGERIRPTRQEVFYFGAPAGSDRYGPDRLPVWIDFGERIVYGLPDVHGRGVKIADDTRGEPFDPTSGDRTPTPAGIARARSALAERFPAMAKAPLLSAEVCQYENSPDGHLILDRHPEAGNVWLAGGGSGHGFKLSPAVGEMIARRIATGEPFPAMFRLDRIRERTEPTTQFRTRQ
ncbi:MAG TPA: FAD-dependent oxidoreductase [Thermoanaerobaculia bacterium]|nr:FAD-dependent oxidoreductase [Thermoanaerobaculia bacterium]